MWGVNAIKNTAQKISDLIFEEKEEYEEIFEEETTAVKGKENVHSEQADLKQRAVGGETIAASASYAVPQQFTAVKPTVTKSERPKLTVHESPALQIKVFVPKGFDEVRHIADCLKNKQAAVINYERVDEAEKQRISDFMNGACYVLNGTAELITHDSVLYVPKNVTISSNMFEDNAKNNKVLMPSFHKVREG